ncbi:MAG: LysM peptidoglycan-binding domain-containing protein [Myxococcales bacterium]|nr:LysM peptidoglycan-binding domain-containing protein [Myxococcales bacterium]
MQANQTVLPMKKMKVMFRFLCWFGVSMWFLLSGDFARAAEKYRYYTVQPGDSCWSIAQMLFGRGRDYTIIHKYNDLGPMPHILKPGQRLKIPLSAPQPDAELEKKRREVKTKSPRALDWYDAREGMALWRLYRVSTGKKSMAVVRFERRARIRMRERALLVIQGRDGRQKKKKSGKVIVQEGTIRAGLDSLDDDTAIPIETPAAKIALKASAAQIGVDEKKTSVVSIFRGKADVSAQGKSVHVPDDHGTFVKKGKPPAPPRRLPRAPRWKDDVVEAFVPLTPSQGQEALGLLWQGHVVDVRYRVEAATDKLFREVYWDDLVPAKNPSSLQRYILPIKKIGHFYVRLSAVDKDGLESRPSKILHIQAAPLQLSRRLVRKKGEDLLIGVGLLQISPPKETVQVALIEGERDITQADKLPFQSFTEPVRLQKPGRYTLFFRRGEKGSVLTAVRLSLLRVTAELSLSASQIEVKGAEVKATLRLFDENKLPALLPELMLEIVPGGAKVPFRCVGRGVCEAMVPAPTAYESKALYLRASWAAGDLTVTMLPVKRPPGPLVRVPPRRAEPPKEPELRWPEQVLVRKGKKGLADAKIWEWEETPLVLEFARSFPGLPARGARPMTWAGARLFFGDYSPPNAANNGPLLSSSGGLQKPVVSRFSIAGELAFLQGRMSVELDLPLLNVILTQPEGYPDNISYGKLGDIRLGVKGLLYSRKDLTVGASLRFVLPTGGYRFPPRDKQGAPLSGFPPLVRYTPGKIVGDTALSTYIDPALLLEWKPVSWFMLHTNLAFVLDTDFGANTAFVFTGNLGLHLRWRFLSFVTEIHLAAPAVEGGLPVSFGVSAGLRAYLGQIRISLTGGGMIPQDPTLPGDFHVGIGFDLAFPSMP